ncbi:MAG: ABC transporter permease [Anaerovoracaceae bacterium]
MKTIMRYRYAVMITVIALLLWELLVFLLKPAKWILPAPSQIFRVLIEQRELILASAWVTVYEAMLGFAIAIIVSVFLAILIDRYLALKQGLFPILVASQTVPIFAIAPLLFIWFGFGILPKIIIVAIICFFPIVTNLVDGLSSTDRSLIRLLQSMDATEWQIFTKVKFPASLPYFFSGLRVAATYSVMGAIIGEWLVANKGLGLYIKNTFNSFQTDQVFAGIIVIVAISVFIYGTILLLERLLIPWNKQEEEY